MLDSVFKPTHTPYNMSARRPTSPRNESKYSPHYRRSEEKTQTTISLEKTLLDDIKQIAHAENRSISNLVVTVMEKYVKDYLSKGR